MAPLIPALISLVTSIPKILQAVKLLKPVKDQIKKVEKEYHSANDDNIRSGKISKKTANEQKHALVLEFLKEYLLPKISKYEITEYDLDTMIRFICLFIGKMNKLRGK